MLNFFPLLQTYVALNKTPFLSLVQSKRYHIREVLNLSAVFGGYFVIV